MKSREIWEMTPEEIQGKLDDAYAELFNLRFQFSTSLIKITQFSFSGSAILTESVYCDRAIVSITLPEPDR